MGPKKHVKPVSRWLPLSENVSVMQTLVVPGIDDLSVRPEDLSLEDLRYCCKFIEQSNKTLEVENSVIERYLQRMDPSLIARMESILEAAASALQKAERAAQLQAASSYLSIPSHASRRNTEETLFSTPRSNSTAKSFSISGGSSKFTALALADKGPRVQPNHKIEIINREIEELRNSLEKFKQKAKNHNYIMKCKNEELTIRLQEVMEMRNYFEKKIVEEGVDKMTKKVPAEKFIRYLETKLQAEDSAIDKLRMKTNSIKNHLNRLHQQLIQKEELGEVLHAVDFEQLKIENQECQERLDEKIGHLVNVKRINGRCGTILNFSKKKLQEQMNRLSQLHHNVEVKEGMIKDLLMDEEKINHEVEVALKNVNKITDLMKSYTVPGVIEYIHKKAELHSLKKNVKICERQLKLRELALASQVQRIKAISEHNVVKKPSRVLSGQSSRIIANIE